MFFPNRKSVLYHFDVEGGYLPIDDYKAVGERQSFASYYLKRYYQHDITMKQFGQLADFIIRYIVNEKYRLIDSVGLDPINPYPQIVYIPDDVRYCPAYEDRRPRLDCSPTLQDLIEFKTYSEQRLQSIHDQQFFTNLQPVTRP
jgi:Proteasome subunit